jgi:hypothetical protein
MLVGEYSLFGFGQDTTTPLSPSGSNQNAVQSAVQASIQQSAQEAPSTAAAPPATAAAAAASDQAPAPVPVAQSFLNFLVQGSSPTGVAPLANATVSVVGPNDERSVSLTDPGGYVRFTLAGTPGTTYHYEIKAPPGYVDTYGDAQASDKSDAIHQKVTLDLHPEVHAAIPKTPLVILVVLLIGIIGGNYLLKRY